MKQQAFSVVSQVDQLTLSGLIAQPDGEARGLVQIAHGMAEHKERYLGFIEQLTKAGYAVLIADHRGHGKSLHAQDSYGWFGEGGAEALVEDMHQLTRFFKERFPGKPLMLFGHSMGSLAVRVYAKKYDGELAALVVCGCPSENPAAGMGLFLTKLLGRIQGPKHKSAFMDKLMFSGNAKRFPNEKSAFAWLNSDAKGVAAYERDPECGFLFTLNGYQALLTLMKDCYRVKGYGVQKPEMPILFVSGGDDPCMIDRESLERAAQKLRDAGYKRVSVKVYDHLRHEILLEPASGQVMRDVMDFLDDSIPR
ncbi:MAG: alpha/beta fold hydrolase [Clostridia bacterium]